MKIELKENMYVRTKDYYPYYDKYLFEYEFSTCKNFLNDEVKIIEEQ